VGKKSSGIFPQSASLRPFYDAGGPIRPEFLKKTRQSGKTIFEVPPAPDREDRLVITKEALLSGDDVINQAALQAGSWGGYADFLMRVNTPSALGEFS
jgi:hypothetical protein